MDKLWKVLIVDDQSDSRQFIRSILESELPVQIITAENGQEGCLQAKKENPDLIILDVMMPIKDGCDTFSDLHNDPSTTNIPVIMLSSLTEVRYYMDGKPKDEQPKHFVEKPVEPALLLRLARSLLN